MFLYRTMVHLTVSNVVAIGKLSAPLDLELLHKNLPGSEKSTSHWLKYRMPEDNRYVAFYQSGKFLLTGKDVLEKKDNLCKEILISLRNAGFSHTLEEFVVTNLVCNFKIVLNQNLEKIYINLDSDKVEYEPEQFPGLIYKDFGVTFLLFSTGSMVITGAKTLQMAEEATQDFIDLLNKL